MIVCFNLVSFRKESTYLIMPRTYPWTYPRKYSLKKYAPSQSTRKSRRFSLNYSQNVSCADSPPPLDESDIQSKCGGEDVSGSRTFLEIFIRYVCRPCIGSLSVIQDKTLGTRKLTKFKLSARFSLAVYCGSQSKYNLQCSGLLVNGRKGLQMLMYLDRTEIKEKKVI